ncbi:transketolase [Metamycoplasma spumans]|uniref:transketolase n=1 Tax=Metamycoplasma spumans TaxID=92406 RepID=UPI0034DD906F
MKNSKRIDQLAVDNLKINSLAMVSKGEYGYSSINISGAKIFHALFYYNFRFNINDRNWIARDRFVLSASQCSPLYYSILRFYGIVSKEDLENYGNYKSALKGNVELSREMGIDASTLPSGQGIAIAVGMAISESNLSLKFPEASHYVYTFCSKLELEEGVAQEALEYAGLNKLKKLIVLCDSSSLQYSNYSISNNNVNSKKKYEAMGIKYLLLKDASSKSISKAIKLAKKSSKPTIIEVSSKFGENLIKEDIASLFGNQLSQNELEEFKDKTKFQKTDLFDIYNDVKDAYLKRAAYLESIANKWTASDALINYINDEVKENINDIGINSEENLKSNVELLLNNISDKYQNIFISSSNLSNFQKMKSLNGVYASNNRLGRALLIGQRRFAMANISNGLALHSNFRPIIFSPLVFSSYMLSAIRTSALMKLKVLYIFSHDSVLINKSGPIYQPIEQLAQLKAIPELVVLRPCDINELKGALEFYLNSATGPVVISLGENILNNIKNSSKNEFKEGSYYLLRSNSKYTLISAGRDIEVAYKIANELNISLISAGNIKNLDKLNYRKEFAISFESLSKFGWSKYAKYNLGIDSFGITGSDIEIAKHFYIDKNSLKEKIQKIINSNDN